MRNRVLTSLLVASCWAGACGGGAGEVTSVAVQPRTDPSIASPYAVGEQSLYGFEWSAQGRDNAGLLGDTPTQGGLHLRGHLRLRAYPSPSADATGAPSDDLWLGVTLTDLDEARLEVLGQNVLRDPSQSLVGIEGILILPREGGSGRLRLPPHAPPVLRQLMAGLLANVDLTAAHWRAGGTTTTRTAHGLAEVSYAREGATLLRTIESYSRLDALPGVGLDADWQTGGQAQIDLDGDGRLLAIDAVELVALGDTETPLGYESATKFALRRESRGHAHTAQVPDVVTWDDIDLDAAPDTEAVERELARSFSEGMTAEDLAAVVTSASNGLRPSKGALVRARGLLRGWPEQALPLRAEYTSATDTRTRAFILDLLVSADTPQAQAIVADVLDPSVAGEDLPELLQHLSLLRSPTADIALLLFDVHEASVEASDDRTRRASLYAAGAVAKGLGFADGELAERLHILLVDELAGARAAPDIEAALAGLANAGRADDQALAIAYVHHEDIDVRAQVTSSLRAASPGPHKDALFSMIADPQRHVSASALSVIDHYFDDDADTRRLAAMVINGSHHPDLVGPLSGVLAKRGLDEPLTREALRSLLLRAEDVRTRLRIEKLLGRRV